MKKFYWKAFWGRLGKKNTIGLVLTALFAVISTIHLFDDYGFDIVFQSFVLSMLYDEIKKVKTAITEVREHYSVNM